MSRPENLRRREDLETTQTTPSRRGGNFGSSSWAQEPPPPSSSSPQPDRLRREPGPEQRTTPLPEVPPPPQDPRGIVDNFVAGYKSTVAATRASENYARVRSAELDGDWKRAQEYRQRTQQQLELAQAEAPDTQSLYDVDSLGSAVGYTAGLFGSALDSMSKSVAGGTVGGVAGTALGMIPVLRPVAKALRYAGAFGGATLPQVQAVKGGVAMSQDLDPVISQQPLEQRERAANWTTLGSTALEGVVPGLIGARTGARAIARSQQLKGLGDNLPQGRVTNRGAFMRDSLEEGLTEIAQTNFEQFALSMQNDELDMTASLEDSLNAFLGGAAGGALGNIQGRLTEGVIDLTARGIDHQRNKDIYAEQARLWAQRHSGISLLSGVGIPGLPKIRGRRAMYLLSNPETPVGKLPEIIENTGGNKRVAEILRMIQDEAKIEETGTTQLAEGALEKFLENATITEAEAADVTRLLDFLEGSIDLAGLTENPEYQQGRTDKGNPILVNTPEIKAAETEVARRIVGALYGDEDSTELGDIIGHDAINVINNDIKMTYRDEYNRRTEEDERTQEIEAHANSEGSRQPTSDEAFEWDERQPDVSARDETDGLNPAKIDYDQRVSIPNASPRVTKEETRPIVRPYFKADSRESVGAYEEANYRKDYLATSPYTTRYGQTVTDDDGNTLHHSDGTPVTSDSAYGDTVSQEVDLTGFEEEGFADHILRKAGRLKRNFREDESLDMALDFLIDDYKMRKTRNNNDKNKAEVTLNHDARIKELTELRESTDYAHKKEVLNQRYKIGSMPKQQYDDHDTSSNEYLSNHDLSRAQESLKYTQSGAAKDRAEKAAIPVVLRRTQADRQQIANQNGMDVNQVPEFYTQLIPRAGLAAIEQSRWINENKDTREEFDRSELPNKAASFATGLSKLYKRPDFVGIAARDDDGKPMVNERGEPMVRVARDKKDVGKLRNTEDRENRNYDEVYTHIPARPDTLGQIKEVGAPQIPFAFTQGASGPASDRQTNLEYIAELKRAVEEGGEVVEVVVADLMERMLRHIEPAMNTLFDDLRDKFFNADKEFIGTRIDKAFYNKIVQLNKDGATLDTAALITHFGTYLDAKIEEIMDDGVEVSSINEYLYENPDEPLTTFVNFMRAHAATTHAAIDGVRSDIKYQDYYGSRESKWADKLLTVEERKEREEEFRNKAAEAKEAHTIEVNGEDIPVTGDVNRAITGTLRMFQNGAWQLLEPLRRADELLYEASSETRRYIDEGFENEGSIPRPPTPAQTDQERAQNAQKVAEFKDQPRPTVTTTAAQEQLTALATKIAESLPDSVPFKDRLNWAGLLIVDHQQKQNRYRALGMIDQSHNISPNSGTTWAERNQLDAPAIFADIRDEVEIDGTQPMIDLLDSNKTDQALAGAFGLKNMPGRVSFAVLNAKYPELDFEQTKRDTMYDVVSATTITDANVSSITNGLPEQLGQELERLNSENTELKIKITTEFENYKQLEQAIRDRGQELEERDTLVQSALQGVVPEELLSPSERELLTTSLEEEVSDDDLLKRFEASEARIELMEDQLEENLAEMDALSRAREHVATTALFEPRQLKESPFANIETRKPGEHFIDNDVRSYLVEQFGDKEHSRKADRTSVLPYLPSDVTNREVGNQIKASKKFSQTLANRYEDESDAVNAAIRSSSGLITNRQDGDKPLKGLNSSKAKIDAAPPYSLYMALIDSVPTEDSDANKAIDQLIDKLGTVVLTSNSEVFQNKELFSQFKEYMNRKGYYSLDAHPQYFFPGSTNSAYRSDVKYQAELKSMEDANDAFLHAIMNEKWLNESNAFLRGLVWRLSVLSADMPTLKEDGKSRPFGITEADQDRLDKLGIQLEWADNGGFTSDVRLRATGSKKTDEDGKGGKDPKRYGKAADRRQSVEDKAQSEFDQKLKKEEARSTLREAAARVDDDIRVGLETAANLADPETLEPLTDFFASLEGVREEQRMRRDLRRGILTNKRVLDQISATREDNPLGLTDEQFELIRTDENALYAYAFQLHHLGMLNITPTAENWFKDLFTWLLNLVGITTRTGMIDAAFTEMSSGNITNRKDLPKFYSNPPRRFDTAIGEIGQIIHTSAKRMIRTSADVLKDYGPEGKELSRLFFVGEFERGRIGKKENFLPKRQRQTDAWLNRYASVMSKFSDEEMMEGYEDFSTNNQDTTTEAGTVMRDFVNAFYDYQEKRGARFNERLPGGGYKTIRPSQRDWRPPAAWNNELIVDNQFEFIKLLMSEGYSEIEAEDFVGAIEWSGGHVSFLDSAWEKESSRPGTGPQSGVSHVINADNIHKFKKFLSADPTVSINRMLMQGVHKAEFANSFGHRGEVIDKFLLNLEAKGNKKQDVEYMQRTIDALLGRLTYNLNPTYRTWIGNALSVQNMAILPLVTFSSLPEAWGSAIASGEMIDGYDSLKDGVKEIFGQLETEGELEQLAREMGILTEDIMTNRITDVYNEMMMGTSMKNMNQKFFKVVGLEGWTRGLRKSAAQLAVFYLIDHRNNPEKLDLLNIEPKDVKLDDDGKLIFDEFNPDDPVVHAINSFVDQAVLRPGAAHRPAWGSDPRFLLIWHLKQFTFAFHAVYTREMMRNVFARDAGERVNWSMINAMAMMIPTIMVGDLVKNIIFPSSGYWNASFSEHLFSGVNRSGVLGLGSFVADEYQSTTKFGDHLGASLLGPTYGHMQEFFTGNEIRGLARLVPGWSAWNRWYQFAS